MIKTAIVQSSFEVEHCLDIRRSVFCGLMHMTSEQVIDADDRDAVHALATSGAKAVGSGRISNRQGEWWLELVAVLPAFRGQGVGWDIMKTLIAEAEKRGISELRVKGEPPFRTKLDEMGFENGVIPVGLDQG